MDTLNEYEQYASAPCCPMCGTESSQGELCSTCDALLLAEFAAGEVR